jgi:hypothetical protein
VGLHELIPLDERERWIAALADVPHGPAHTWGFCRAVQLTSDARTYLYRYEGRAGRVVCALAERELAGEIDVATPYGFGGFATSGDCAGFAAAWREFALERGWVCGYIALNPVFADAGPFPPEEVLVHNRLYVLDLRQAPERLWAALSRNRRRQLRDWEMSGARLELNRSRLARFLVDNYSAFFTRKGAGPATEFRRETVAAIAELDGVLLVGADAGELEAVTAFGYTPHTADALFAVSRPGGEGHSARLVWWGVESLRELDVPYLNLGGGIREGDDVAEFKRRFGASQQPLASLRQVYRPDVYERLCAEAGVSPGRSGWFPPYRAPGAGAERGASRRGSGR